MRKANVNPDDPKIPLELKWEKKSGWNRSHWENIRSALQMLSKAPGPVPYSKILYACRSTHFYLPSLMAEVTGLGLVEIVNSHGQKRGVRRDVVITDKGRQVLHLLDQQAQLIPKAPWILENTQ